MRACFNAVGPVSLVNEVLPLRLSSCNDHGWKHSKFLLLLSILILEYEKKLTKLNMDNVDLLTGTSFPENPT